MSKHETSVEVDLARDHTHKNTFVVDGVNIADHISHKISISLSESGGPVVTIRLTPDKFRARIDGAAIELDKETTELIEGTLGYVKREESK